MTSSIPSTVRPSSLVRVEPPAGAADHRCGAEGVHDLDRTDGDRGLRAFAQGAARLELVVVASAEGVTGARPTEQPDDLVPAVSAASGASPTSVFCAEAPWPATATRLPA